MELSRAGVRPLKITDLSLYILHCVFGYFQDVRINQGGAVNWDHYSYSPDCPNYTQERRESVRGVRLACRLFCHLATPLLYPVLKVSLSQSSLDLIDAFSRNPAMAGGIRGVMAMLDYRP
jgi:hypothetical protein